MRPCVTGHAVCACEADAYICIHTLDEMRIEEMLYALRKCALMLSVPNHLKTAARLEQHQVCRVLPKP